MPTNHHDHDQHGAHHHHAPKNPESPGYETSDINVNGLVVFLTGLAGSLFVFFLLCYVMGQVINNQLQKADGPADKWHQAAEGKGKNLATNPEMQQQSLQQISKTFPEPRLEMDDGLQNTADLHAREDLFLEHYSSKADGKGIRIPIERAMQLVAQRGLPVNAQAAETPMAGDTAIAVQAPLTDGFARTGYELEQIEAREQQMNFKRAENARVEK
jgi:hypothetical protein